MSSYTPVLDTGDITDTVAIGIKKALGIELVKYSLFEPDGEIGPGIHMREIQEAVLVFRTTHGDILLLLQRIINRE